MSEPKERRQKIKVPVREPHKRTNTGIFNNLRQLPHPVEEILGLNRIESTPITEVENNTASREQVLSSPDSDGPPESGGPSRISSPPEFDGPSESDSPSYFNSPPESGGPPENEATPLQNGGPPESGGPPEINRAVTRDSPLEIAALSYDRRPTFSLLNSLPDEAGYMLAFHQITDYLDRQLTPSEQSLYRHLLRLTWGFGRALTIVSIPKLAERTNLGSTAAREAARGLEKKGLIKKLSHVFGSNQVQGIEFEVFAPLALVRYLQLKDRRRRPPKNDGPSDSGGPPESDGMKVNVLFLKEHTQTQAGVSVGSRFSLEDCRRYADHLKQTGQGITNPGGYATKIFRSGEVDSFIEIFLNPPLPIKIDQCPDCNGSGFIYPEGFDKGIVAKCKHEKIQREP